MALFIEMYFLNNIKAILMIEKKQHMTWKSNIFNGYFF